MLTTLISVITALGGFESLKYLFNRKAHRRMAQAQADREELHTLKETTEFLQEQLKGKEERFAEQTLLVRRLNAEALELTRRLARVQVQLARRRCDRLTCPGRKPPFCPEETAPLRPDGIHPTD